MQLFPWMSRHIRTALLMVALGLGFGSLAGCDEGRFEEAGEEIDEAGEEMEEEIE